MRRIMFPDLPSDMTPKIVSHFVHTRGIVSLQLASFKLITLVSQKPDNYLLDMLEQLQEIQLLSLIGHGNKIFGNVDSLRSPYW